LGLQFGGDQIGQAVVIGEINTAVLQRTNDHAALEGAFNHRLNGLQGGDVHLLQDGGQDDVGVFWGSLEPVVVHADDVHIATFLSSSGGAQTDRAGDRHDDVGALVHQALAHGAAVIGALEVTREQAF